MHYKVIEKSEKYGYYLKLIIVLLVISFILILLEYLNIFSSQILVIIIACLFIVIAVFAFRMKKISIEIKGDTIKISEVSFPNQFRTLKLKNTDIFHYDLVDFEQQEKFMNRMGFDDKYNKSLVINTKNIPNNMKVTIFPNKEAWEYSIYIYTQYSEELYQRIEGWVKGNITSESQNIKV